MKLEPLLYPVPENEATRLDTLRELKIYESDPSPDFESLVQLAASALDCPIALISIVEEHEQWFKANCGLGADRTHRKVAFCAHTISAGEPLIVPDARVDLRFKHNPLVTGEPHIIFYAGIPLSLDGVHHIGSICVIDHRPRVLNESNIKQLKLFARIANGLLAGFSERRKLEAARKLESEKSDELKKTASLLEQVKSLSGVGGWELQLDPPKLSWSEETKRIHEVPSEYVPELKTAIEFYAPEARDTILHLVTHAIEDGTPWDIELPLTTFQGRRIWVRSMGKPIIEKGCIVSILGAFQDITKQRNVLSRITKSENEARRVTDQLKNIISYMNEGVSVFDSNETLSMWNTKYTELFDAKDNEVRCGTSLSEILSHEESRGKLDSSSSALIDKMRSKTTRGDTLSTLIRRDNGTIIQSKYTPLPGGGWVGTHSDVTLQVTSAEKHEHAALHDALTGLPNRLHFDRKLQSAAKDPRTKNAFVLLMIDLDGFKEINDNYGHQTGDTLLVEAAKRIKSCVRQNDLVARIGGDEFAVISECLRSDAKQHAVHLANRVNRSMERAFTIQGKIEHVGASVGICVADSPKLHPEDLVERADRALYKSKETNVGGFTLYDSSFLENESNSRHKENAVRDSVINKSLSLNFQPIFDLATMNKSCGEALVRWRKHDAGAPTTMDLIETAEEIGVISEIDSWVISEGVRTAKEWPSEIALSINISTSQLGSGKIRDHISNCISYYNFSHRKLEIEVKEEVMLCNNIDAIEELIEIQKSGVRISLDNFGRSHASLSCLKNFPFDKVKIDKSLISEISTNSPSRAIVENIVSLSRHLGYLCTAEAIETNEVLSEVMKLGCGFGQGFYLGKPVDASDFLPS